MKKIIFVLMGFASLQMSAQSFYKGALVASLNYGIDIYNVKEHLVYKGSAINGPAPKDTTDGAGAHGLRLSAEYGVVDWLGVGLSGKINTYLTSKDKTTGITPTASGGEIGLLVNFHMLRKQKFNLSGGFDLGYSHLTYRSHDALGTEVYGDGSWFNLHITPRLYFGRFGINMTLNFPFINYPNLVSSDATFNKDYSFSWKSTGWGMNFGVQYRFLNPR